MAGHKNRNNRKNKSKKSEAEPKDNPNFTPNEEVIAANDVLLIEADNAVSNASPQLITCSPPSNTDTNGLRNVITSINVLQKEKLFTSFTEMIFYHSIESLKNLDHLQESCGEYMMRPASSPLISSSPIITATSTDNEGSSTVVQGDILLTQDRDNALFWTIEVLSQILLDNSGKIRFKQNCNDKDKSRVILTPLTCLKAEVNDNKSSCVSHMQEDNSSKNWSSTTTVNCTTDHNDDDKVVVGVENQEQQDERVRSTLLNVLELVAQSHALLSQMRKECMSMKYWQTVSATKSTFNASLSHSQVDPKTPINDDVNEKLRSKLASVVAQNKRLKQLLVTAKNDNNIMKRKISELKMIEELLKEQKLLCTLEVGKFQEKFMELKEQNRAISSQLRELALQYDVQAQQLKNEIEYLSRDLALSNARNHELQQEIDKLHIKTKYQQQSSSSIIKGGGIVDSQAVLEAEVEKQRLMLQLNEMTVEYQDSMRRVKALEEEKLTIQRELSVKDDELKQSNQHYKITEQNLKDRLVILEQTNVEKIMEQEKKIDALERECNRLQLQIKLGESTLQNNVTPPSSSHVEGHVVNLNNEPTPCHHNKAHATDEAAALIITDDDTTAQKVRQVDEVLERLLRNYSAVRVAMPPDNEEMAAYGIMKGEVEVVNVKSREEKKSEDPPFSMTTSNYNNDVGASNEMVMMEVLVDVESENHLLREQISLLKQEIRRFERGVKREETFTDLENCKNKILKFMLSDTTEKEILITEIASILQLDQDEVRKLRPFINTSFTEMIHEGGRKSLVGKVSDWVHYMGKWV